MLFEKPKSAIKSIRAILYTYVHTVRVRSHDSKTGSGQIKVIPMCTYL